MTIYILSPFRSPKIPDQQSLTLHWRSFWWWGREGITICFAYKGGQKFLYDWLQPIGSVIAQNASPKIVDPLLTLIFKMGQGLYCIVFCLSRRPNIPFWLTATYRQCVNRGRMSKNCWCSVDGDFQDAAGWELRSVLPTKAAKNSFMTDYNQLAVWLTRMQDQKSLTLCWCSFSRWGREGIAICFAYKDGQRFL